MTQNETICRKWDERFLLLAQHIAQWSKDPSTKCGAVIVRPDRTIVSLGYNGFPRGMSDAPELYKNRVVKYRRVIHAEMNAILTAGAADLRDCCLYTWPIPPCERCAAHILQTGIRRVVSLRPGESCKADLRASIHRGEQYFTDAGVQWTCLPDSLSV